MGGTLIGLKDVHFAEVISDTAETLSYGIPIPVAKALTARINPNSNSETLFVNDKPYDTTNTLSEIEIELNLADISAEIQAIWLGHTLLNGKLIRKSSDVPIWVALGFKALKSNGHFRYIWFTKGKFMVPEKKFQTRSNDVEFNSLIIQGKFVTRVYDQQWKKSIDTDHPSYTTIIGENWFKENGELEQIGGFTDMTMIRGLNEQNQISSMRVIDGAAKVTFDKQDEIKESLAILETLTTTLNGKIDTLDAVIDSIKDTDGIKKITDTVDVQLTGSYVEIDGVTYAVSGGDTLRGKAVDRPDAVAAHAVIPYCYYFSIDTGVVEATDGMNWVVI